MNNIKTSISLSSLTWLDLWRGWPSQPLSSLFYTGPLTSPENAKLRYCISFTQRNLKFVLSLTGNKSSNTATTSVIIISIIMMTICITMIIISISMAFVIIVIIVFLPPGICCCLRWRESSHTWEIQSVTTYTTSMWLYKYLANIKPYY